MNHNIWMYIFVTALVTYCIRALPMTLIRKPITDPFIRSFLYYVPYVTLSVMTFPAIFQATNSALAGLIAFMIGIGLAWKGASIFQVSVSCCVIVFILEQIIIH